MGIKEDAMWAAARKMGMPESAIAAVKSKYADGKLPDIKNMMKMFGDEKKKKAMLQMAQKMGMPPMAKGMDGNILLKKMAPLSRVKSIKDIPQLTKVLFPGTHCPLIGAAMVAAGIKDCLLVIVGTDECSYYTKSMTIDETFGGIGGRCVSIVLNSHDVTFGSAGTLHKAFKEITEEYHPACVMLVTTCVVEIIGDDYDAFAEELSQQYNLPVMAVHTEHFKCEDHFPGFERGITACFNLMHEVSKTDVVNVLGQRTGNFSETELYSILNEAGVEIGLQLPTGCTAEEIKQAAAAKVNIVVHDIALPLAKKMQEKFAIPYVYFNKMADPEKIYASYQKLFAYLDLALPTKVKILYEESKSLQVALAKDFKNITYIYGNTPFDCFELNSYLCKLGMVPQVIQSNRFPEDSIEVQEILQYTDPYMVKAANIAPLQYVYDVLHPYLYLGHEFEERLRVKGIAVVHSDPAGKLLGFEVTMMLLKILHNSIAQARTYRQEAGI